ncbi:MAG: preprotein translocase subunit SecG [Candidatus Marinimicrobia bacterium]|nr:preprotein translocase subunit SecG [Candidatus Neomarinimicrobiota bacterium]
MLSVVLVIHLLIAFSLIGVVLLQKTDSSAMGGMGGGAVSVNNLMRPRSRPNPLTRMTTYLGIAFFATSLGLAVIAKQQATTTSILDIPVGGSSEGIPSVSDSVQVPVAGASDPAINLEPSLDSQVPMVPNE